MVCGCYDVATTATSTVPVGTRRVLAVLDAADANRCRAATRATLTDELPFRPWPRRRRLRAANPDRPPADAGGERARRRPDRGRHRMGELARSAVEHRCHARDRRAARGVARART